MPISKVTKDTKSGVTLRILQAGQGDSILISFPDPTGITRNLLVDGGNTRREYRRVLLQEALSVAARGEHLDLVVATHFDNDHIKGLEYLLRDLHSDSADTPGPELLKTCWFNSPELNRKLLAKASPSGDIGLRTAQSLEGHLLCKNKDGSWSLDNPVAQGGTLDLHGAKITVLSPTRENLKRQAKQHATDIASSKNDYKSPLADLVQLESSTGATSDQLDASPSNACTIALLFEYKEVKILLPGDAIPKTLDAGLEQLLKKREVDTLPLNAMILPHHGSIRNISRKLLALTNTNTFIFSTNGKAHGLPHKRTIARIIHACGGKNAAQLEFLFNYPHVLEAMAITTRELATFELQCHPPNTEHGIEILL